MVHQKSLGNGNCDGALPAFCAIAQVSTTRIILRKDVAFVSKVMGSTHFKPMGKSGRDYVRLAHLDRKIVLGMC